MLCPILDLELKSWRFEAWRTAPGNATDWEAAAGANGSPLGQYTLYTARSAFISSHLFGYTNAFLLPVY